MEIERKEEKEGNTEEYYFKLTKVVLELFVLLFKSLQQRTLHK